MRTETIFLPLDQYRRVFESFSRLESFTVIHTGHSTQFVAPGRDKILLTDRRLSYRALGMMLSLKNEVRRNYSKLVLEYGKTEYFAFKNLVGSGVCTEYDLEHAYLRTLYEMGAISDDMYGRLEKVEKGERLAVVGSLATRKVIVDYQYGEKIATGTKQDRDLIKVWKTITWLVDTKMRKWFLGDQNSLFYWVDALFTESNLDLPNTKRKECRYHVEGRRINFQDTHGRQDRRYFPILSCHETVPPDIPPAITTDERAQIGT